MKQTLIRLTCETKDGIFDNNFNESLLEVKPNSQLALQSMTLKRKIDFVVLDPTNNKILFQLNTGNTKEIFLKQGTFTNNNIEDLFQDLEEKIRDELDVFNEFDFGVDIQMFIRNDNRIQIDFEQGRQLGLIDNDRTNILPYAFTRNISYPGAGGGKRMTRGPDNPNTGLLKDAFLATKKPFNLSCGEVRAGIFSFNNVDVAVKSGFVLGLIDEVNYIALQGDNPEITEDDLTFAVRTDQVNNAPYQFVQDAQGYQVTSETPVIGQNGMEYMAIQVTKGKMKLGIYKQGSNTLTQFGTDIDVKTILPLFFFLL